MKYLKVTLFTFNLLIWLAGCTVSSLGIWLLMDPNKGHLLNLFASDTSPHETVYWLGHLLLGVGLAIFSVGFFGCRAAFHESQCVIVVYMVLLIVVILLETTAAAIFGVMTYHVLTGLEPRLTERLANHYGHDSASDADFSQSFDYAQYKFNCCGIHSDEDFNGTAWWRDSQISGTRRQVPLTCCVLKDLEAKNTGSPMSVISRVFYRNNEKPWLYPRAKDESSCQSQDLSVQKGFRHKEGCLGKVRNWLQYESFALILFGIIVACAQVFGIVTSACLCKSLGDAPPG